MKKILVPVDGSEASAHAGSPDASITLLHVFDAPGVAAMGLKALDGKELQRTREQVSKPTLDRAAAALPGFAKLERRSEIGDPATEILAVAKSGGFDHIVMGSRGLSPLAELTIGSVSDHVLRSAPCPITIVH